MKVIFHYVTVFRRTALSRKALQTSSTFSLGCGDLAGYWFRVYGLWFMVYSLWFMVYGIWFWV
ncbi:hypothetical protein T484DRAFT_2783618 [Baffinella frigidus]|nr:hypothetical protein T484DRAFT_2783618 [Cryptophyta sp. CCMP2293]